MTRGDSWGCFTHQLSSAAMVSRFARRSGWWNLACGLLATGFISGGYYLYFRATAGCPPLRGNAVLAGTNERLAKLVDSSCHGQLDSFKMLASDLIIIAGYWLLGTFIIANGWWRYEAAAAKRVLPVVVWLPTFVACLDILEDLLLFASLDVSNVVPVYSSNLLAGIVFTVSWTKWSLTVLTVLVGIMSATVWYSRRQKQYPRGEADAADPKAHEPATEVEQKIDPTHLAMDNPRDWEDPELEQLEDLEPGPKVGICFSGGGIRSAAFSLGALQALEQDGGANAITAKARYVAAVSGGSWAATAWTIDRALQTAQGHAAAEIFTRLKTPGGRKGFQPQKFLANGRLSVNGLIGWAILCSGVNIVLVAALVFVVAWPLGFLMGTVAMRPELPEHSTLHALPDGALLKYVALGVVLVGVVIVALCGFFSKAIARNWVAGAAVVVLGLFTVAYLVWLPAFFLAIKGTPADTPGTRVIAYGAISTPLLASVAASVWRMISGPVTKEVTGVVTKHLPKLVGVAIVIGWSAWGCIVMYYAARRYWLDDIAIGGWQPDSGRVALIVWLVAMAFVGLVYALLSPNWPTLHDMYASRLTTTFDSTNRPSKGLRRDSHTGMTWDGLASVSKPSKTAQVPELILCCAQQRVGISEGGLRAESFTISPHWVRQGKRSLPRPWYSEATTSIRSRLRRFSNAGGLEYVAPWLATTGAALASAMGRQSIGTANALLASVNADLGIWLPNVIKVQAEFVSRAVDRVRRRPTRERWTQQEPMGEDEFAFTQVTHEYATHLVTGDTRHPLTPSMHDQQTLPEWDLASRSEKGGREVRKAWRKRLPKPRFGYILKEVLGWYSRRDPYAFITDGGHWENLGLVELLRRGCDEIYCIDASADPPGTFATLREAFALEALELGRLKRTPDVFEVLGDMLPMANLLPKAPATSFSVERWDGSLIVIHYAKLQATQDMPPDLRRFAVADPAFPRYSTAKQFLNAKQFESLYALGQFAGQQVIASAFEYSPAMTTRRARQRPPDPV